MNAENGRLKKAFNFTRYLIADNHSTRKALVTTAVTGAFFGGVYMLGGMTQDNAITNTILMGVFSKAMHGTLNVLGHIRQTTTPDNADSGFEAVKNVVRDAYNDPVSTSQIKRNLIIGAAFGAFTAMIDPNSSHTILAMAQTVAAYSIGFALLAKTVMGLDQAMDKRYGYSQTPRFGY